MKKTMKAICLMLVCAMILPLVACGGGGGGGTQNNGPRDLEWLNLESALPIVKEGTEKTLEIVILHPGAVGKTEEKWFYEFVEKEMNINLDVTVLKDGGQQLTLLFADGDLPDIIIGAGLDEAKLMRYGADEGMLQNLTPYITPELTPNLYKIFAENPDIKQEFTDKDGKIWSLDYIGNGNSSGLISRAFINYDWLERAEMETPATLDEFLAMLRAFKKTGSDVTPMGGSWSAENPMLILLNAFGYITEDPKGMDVALRDGKIVLPVADRELFGEYLKLFKQIYDEGLIHKNFFTMGYSDIKTMIAQNKTGYTTAAPFTQTSNFTAWWGAQPLTSQYNTTAQWPVADTTVGDFVISAKSDNVELAMRFADWFFDPTGANYYLSCNGPASTQSEYVYSDLVAGYEVDAENLMKYYPGYIRNQKKFSSLADYSAKHIYLLPYGSVGCCFDSTYDVMMTQIMGYTKEEIYAKYTDVSAEGIQADVRKEYNVDGDEQFRAALEDTMVPFATAKQLPNAYLEPEVVAELANAWTLVNEYATIEIANFVIGRTELNEENLNKYFDEIEALGATKILNAYRNYFEGIYQ